jgi:hypothetical protein
MAEFYMARFVDGPLAGRQDAMLPRPTWTWPLPERLRVLAHDGEPNVALWDADDPNGADLPSLIVDSPNAVTYVKLRESQLPDRVDDSPNVTRGAVYGYDGRGQEGEDDG